MRCTNCEYPLFNLKARQCPECGTSFAPSDFEFVPNSVAFCCPHCDQTYYGRGETGHLVPVEFDCVSCKNHVRMDEMVLRPAAEIDEKETRLKRMPWLERSERGWIKAWFATIVAALVQPGQMMKGVPVEGSTGTAWWFAIASQVLILVLALLPSMCVMAILPVVIGQMSQGQPPIRKLFGVMAGVSGVTLVVMLVISLAFIGVWGLICHGILRMTGGGVERIGRTYQALCFSSGAHAVTIVPCLGPYVGWIWWLVSGVMAIKEAHDIHGGRAAFAVLAMPLAAFASVAGLYLVIIAGVMTTAATSGSTAAAALIAPQAEAAALATEISAFASTHEDAGPGHLLELLPASSSGVGLVISTSGLTSANDIPLQSTTLDRFQRWGPELQRTVAAEVAAALPVDVVAHRLGDYVYTGHGIDFASDDGGLWVAVLALDPAVNPNVGSSHVYCLRLDGTVRRVSDAALAVAIATQNRLRADHDLSPLPDPRIVTHGSPVSGSGDAMAPGDAAVPEGG